MVRGDLVLTIPNPHRGDIGVAPLALILRQAGVSRRAWDAVYPRSSLELRIVGRAFTARQARRKAAPYVNSSELRG